jgi:uracil-DNA glycosylase
MAETAETLASRIRAYLQYQVDMGYEKVILPQSERRTLEKVRQELGECTRCPLHKAREHIVFGEGNPRAQLMFVGEGPGAEEDRQGRPFVGRAGQLLTKMIQAMGMERTDVYIANVVKCRPPENRDPLPLEIRTCLPFLEAQITAVGPQVIVALGRVAAGTLLDARGSLSELRGRFHDRGGIPVMPTYHPSFLLRQEPERRYKAEAWSDLKEVMELLGLPRERTGGNS